MVCSMVKKSLLGAALGAGTLFLVFGTSAPSYVRTAYHKIRQGAKDSVPPQFDIDRARQDIADLKPMFDQNKETLARAEVETEHLEREVVTIQANLDKEQKTIIALQHSLKTGDFRLTGHVSDTANEVKAELMHRVDHFDYTARPAEAEAGDPQGQEEHHQGRSRTAREPADAEVDPAGPAGEHRSPAEDDRGHSVEERVQLRRQRTGPRQADRLRAGRTA